MTPTLFVASPGLRLPDVPSASQQAVETADLLRQLLDVQREQLHYTRIHALNSDGIAKWKKFLDRWTGEFPGIAADCKAVLPVMERVYLKMIAEMVERLKDSDTDDFDSEYVLGEFLDRYGQRIHQLGTIIGQLSPIADTVPAPEAVPAKEPPAQ